MSQLNVDKIVSLAGGVGTAEFQLEASGNFNFDSGTLYIDSTNNRVGVASLTPTLLLVESMYNVPLSKLKLPLASS